MDLKIKYKIVFWIMLFLLIFNLTTVSYIFWEVSKIKKSNKSEQQENNFFVPPGTQRHNRHGFGKNKHDKIVRQMIQTLELDDRQIAEFRQIRQNFVSQMRQYADSLKYFRIKFETEMEKKSPDFKTMELAADKIGYFHKKIRINFLNYYKNLRNILDENQKQKLANFFKEINKKRKHK